MHPLPTNQALILSEIEGDVATTKAKNIKNYGHTHMRPPSSVRGNTLTPLLPTMLSFYRR